MIGPLPGRQVFFDRSIIIKFGPGGKTDAETGLTHLGGHSLPGSYVGSAPSWKALKSSPGGLKPASALASAALRRIQSLSRRRGSRVRAGTAVTAYVRQPCSAARRFLAPALSALNDLTGGFIHIFLRKA